MKCKTGDLAFVIKALRPANIGKVVTVETHIGYLTRGEQFKWNGEVWTAFETDDTWVVSSSSGLETMYGTSKQAIVPDSWLRPIQPDADPVDEDTELTLDDEITV